MDNMNDGYFGEVLMNADGYDGGCMLEDRAQELAAELMQHVLDDMQGRAQEGMLVLLDDDGNAHTVSPMQEDGEQSDQPTSARDRLAQQLRRAERWAQQQEGAACDQQRKCEIEMHNNCIYVVTPESGEQAAEKGKG